MLYAPGGAGIYLSFMLEFLCSNNKDECNHKPISTLPMEIWRLRVQTDSRLIIKQVNEDLQ